MNKSIINAEELHFGIDKDIIEKLNNSNDETIKELIKIMSNIEGYYSETCDNDYDVYGPVKMRGINPLVLKDGKLIKLSSLSSDFSKDYEDTKQYAQRGVYIKFTDKLSPKLLPLLKSGNV